MSYHSWSTIYHFTTLLLTFVKIGDILIPFWKYPLSHLRAKRIDDPLTGRFPYIILKNGPVAQRQSGYFQNTRWGFDSSQVQWQHQEITLYEGGFLFLEIFLPSNRSFFVAKEKCGSSSLRTPACGSKTVEYIVQPNDRLDDLFVCKRAATPCILRLSVVSVRDADQWAKRAYVDVTTAAFAQPDKERRLDDTDINVSHERRRDGIKQCKHSLLLFAAARRQKVLHDFGQATINTRKCRQKAWHRIRLFLHFPSAPKKQPIQPDYPTRKADMCQQKSSGDPRRESPALARITPRS